MNQSETNNDKRDEILNGLYEDVGKFRRAGRKHAVYTIALDSLSMLALAGTAYDYKRESWGSHADIIASLGAVSFIGAQAEFYLYRKHRARVTEALYWIRKIDDEPPNH